jgi:hypothetical protein
MEVSGQLTPTIAAEELGFAPIDFREAIAQDCKPSFCPFRTGARSTAPKTDPMVDYLWRNDREWSHSIAHRAGRAIGSKVRDWLVSRACGKVFWKWEMRASGEGRVS